MGAFIAVLAYRFWGVVVSVLAIGLLSALFIFAPRLIPLHKQPVSSFTLPMSHALLWSTAATAALIGAVIWAIVSRFA